MFFVWQCCLRYKSWSKQAGYFRQRQKQNVRFLNLDKQILLHSQTGAKYSFGCLALTTSDVFSGRTGSVILDYLQILQRSAEAKNTDKRLLTDYDVTRLNVLARDLHISVLVI